MGKIHIMEEGLANKIAAGEVVERPASVVKELVENAVDAKATRIEVEVEEGGLSLIRVSDDGEGMDGEDLPLAFTRHATSKMKHERDLFHIRTLGFRGEALPSIAAVSKVEIASRVKGAPLAQTLRLEAGQVKEKGEKPLPQGTTIWVRELFFNTPARLKYMKSLTTENYHIQDILMRLSLAHPHISFRLLHDGREVFRTNGSGELLHVVHSLYGADVARKVIPIIGEHPDFTLTGLIGKPEWTRGSKQYLTFIVNGRVIRSLLLQRALLEGYQTPPPRSPLSLCRSFLPDGCLSRRCECPPGQVGGPFFQRRGIKPLAHLKGKGSPPANLPRPDDSGGEKDRFFSSFCNGRGVAPCRISRSVRHSEREGWDDRGGGKRSSTLYA
ncbi:MAG: DNA mismatch repair endonuclease MutL [Thermicanus sp.]|nr:DNA mismatch repair endonuclease MutL [Thermicanus sp.]